MIKTKKNKLLTSKTLLIPLFLFLCVQSGFKCNDNNSENTTTETSKIAQEQKIEETAQTKAISDTLDIEEIELGCMDFKHFSNEVIIQSQKQYNDFLNKKVAVPDCNNYQLPEIDFSEKTLLGYKTIAGGCQQPEYTRTLTYNNAANSCTYSIFIKEIGQCKKGWPSMNWIVVQKIPYGYKTNFETKIN